MSREVRVEFLRPEQVIAEREKCSLVFLPLGPLRNTEFATVDNLTFRGEPTGDFTVRREEDPRSATPEEGEKRFQEVTAELAGVIRKALA